MSVIKYSASELADIITLILDTRTVDRFDVLKLVKAYIQQNTKAYNHTYAGGHGASLAEDMDNVVDALKKANPDANKLISAGLSAELLAYNLVANDGTDFSEESQEAVRFCKLAEQASFQYRQSLTPTARPKY